VQVWLVLGFGGPLRGLCDGDIDVQDLGGESVGAYPQLGEEGCGRVDVLGRGQEPQRSIVIVLCRRCHLATRSGLLGGVV
jgi:hypothetical protein